MTQRKIIGFAVIVPVTLVAALLIWAVIQNDGSPGGFAVNDTLGEKEVSAQLGADFELVSIDGDEIIKLSDLRGKIVLVDFWSSWCPPCRQESPALEAAYEDFRDQGVEFVGIAIWDVDSETRKFRDAFGLEYPIVVDSRGATAVNWGVVGLPEKFFVDREGRVVKKYAGPMTRDRLGLELREMLDASPAAALP
ncbi:MAG: redoxin domain-containing protein [Chloroflexi bacterium]|jgi:cytochrome c biogenesis protein CcmG, thiol:disulfide interchange protein DsbE|nr:redoxin domain-containing protein [Chloroflexota bacterium]MBT4074056.1 redoxin domain-containing protein [Chloroflexota bacterium]MBT4514805.1 redoxin domain-containing protein [Chloroflexota bacterium]MBT6682896.1 redoxin domain-containing protein [Chloroflexota bacterium]